MGADGLRNRKCPCHSGRKYKRCCRPLHEGRAAATAELLMRSRYAAYALGLVAYIQATTDPGGPQWQADTDAWAEGIAAFSRGTRFTGLSVRDHVEQGDEAWVTFHAGLSQAGEDASFTERSRFTRAEGRWRYHSGSPN